MMLELMKKRRSIRQFTPKPLSEEIFIRLIEAARTAPSAGNKQPWRFLIVRNRDLIESAAKAVNEECLRLANLCREEFRAEFENYSTNFLQFRHAPALIIPIFRNPALLSRLLTEMATQEEKSFLSSLEHHAALISVSLSIQNILLMAEELGIGACCVTGPLIAEQKLTECFHLPDGWQIAAVIAVGYPDETPDNPGRKSVQTIIKWV